MWAHSRAKSHGVQRRRALPFARRGECFPTSRRSAGPRLLLEALQQQALLLALLAQRVERVAGQRGRPGLALARRAPHTSVAPGPHTTKEASPSLLREHGGAARGSGDAARTLSALHSCRVSTPSSARVRKQPHTTAHTSSARSTRLWTACGCVRTHCPEGVAGLDAADQLVLRPVATHQVRPGGGMKRPLAAQASAGGGQQ